MNKSRSLLIQNSSKVLFCFVFLLFSFIIVFLPFFLFYESLLHALRFSAFPHVQKLFQHSRSSQCRRFFLQVTRNTYRATLISPVCFRDLFHNFVAPLRVAQEIAKYKLPEHVSYRFSGAENNQRIRTLFTWCNAMLLNLLKQKL